MTTTTITRTAVGAPDPCPACDGTGEVTLAACRDEWGNWDAETAPCLTCSGTGDLPDDALVCDECRDAFAADDQVCVHGMTLCGEDRGECRVCCTEIAADRGSDEPWGDR